MRAHQSVAHQPAPMAPAALCIVSSCNFARHAVVDSRCPGCRWSAPWVGRASPLEKRSTGELHEQREDSAAAQPPCHQPRLPALRRPRLGCRERRKLGRPTELPPPLPASNTHGHRRPGNHTARCAKARGVCRMCCSSDACFCEAAQASPAAQQTTQLLSAYAGPLQRGQHLSALHALLGHNFPELGDFAVALPNLCTHLGELALHFSQ